MRGNMQYQKERGRQAHRELTNQLNEGLYAASRGTDHDNVTLRQGLKPHGFFCLSSVRDGLSDGAWLRLGAHRSGGGKVEGASPSRRILSWAVPGPLFFPCLSERDEWPTTPVCGVLGKS